jgi:pimeloyl-ACP methyl ester carboxylesterase
MAADPRGAIPVRSYGSVGPWVVVVHGGPGAVGEAAPIARGLADAFRALEPWQRGSGAEPLTVARHVADLQEVTASHCSGARPAVVGESWGAMLALAFAAAHPESAGPLVLIGCGTFDAASRALFQANLETRLTADLRRRLDALPEQFPNTGERLKKQFELLEPLFHFDAPPADPPDPAVPTFDARAHTETWDDMVRLQQAGVYPAEFAAIRSPVLMLHGAHDPHPGDMIRASLAPFLPQLEYCELARCGHQPWRERAAREEFFVLLRGWLARHYERVL